MEPDSLLCSTGLYYLANIALEENNCARCANKNITNDVIGSFEIRESPVNCESLCELSTVGTIYHECTQNEIKCKSEMAREIT